MSKMKSWLIIALALGCTVSAQNDSIKTVHLIFMNHLDVGYSLHDKPGHLVDVINEYFTVYFPRAVKVIDELLVLGYREQFIYTTHPWLVSLYLDCPPDLVLSNIKLACPDAKNKSDFTTAVQQGFISWHAGPMNMQFELLDESMMEFSVQLSIDLDKRFGLTRKHRTVSQRDVPGTTKAIIPILRKLGIEALSVGVNGATTPPDVPPVFLWKHENQSLITLYHPRGYPNSYGPTPFNPGGLSRKDCAVVEGLDHALCFAFRSDNQGPPMDYKEVLSVYEIARAQFPNAIVKAATFENFTALLQPFADKLPVFTQEIGDVWIQGVSSDPRKTAEMRAMFRARTACFEKGLCSLSDARVYNASRLMLKLAEHTWGSAGNCIDNQHWTNDAFDEILHKPGNIYERATWFWYSQRSFVDLAMEALGNHTLAKMIQAEFAKFQPALPNLSGYSKVQANTPLSCGNFKLMFDEEGAVIQLTDHSGKNWASPDHPMGKFVYHTYSEADFDKFFAATTPYSQDFFLGIGKPNMSKNAAPESKYWRTLVDGLFLNTDNTKVVVSVSMVDPVTHSYYGAPNKVIMQYDCQKTGVDVSVQWFEKRPTRLPEGLNFVFLPTSQPGHKWYLNKINAVVDPLDVVVNGSQRLHAIDKGVNYVNSAKSGLQIVSPDATLANILTSQDNVSAIPLPLQPIKDIQGVAFNLYNNVWETNYIFWYPYAKEDMNQKFRFTLNFV